MVGLMHVIGDTMVCWQDARNTGEDSDLSLCAPVQLLKKFGDQVHVDIIDRLPTPFGLVRSGVAPDHQDTKVAFTDVVPCLPASYLWCTYFLSDSNACVTINQSATDAAVLDVPVHKL